jgi:hypothetical protein
LANEIQKDNKLASDIENKLNPLHDDDRGKAGPIGSAFLILAIKIMECNVV